MKKLWHLLNLLLLLGTLALAYKFYTNALDDIPDYFNWIMAAGIIGISLAQTCFFVIGGSIFGAVQGGMFESMRLGLMVGGMMAVGRLWPFALAWTFGAFLFSPNTILHTALGLLATLVCFMVNRAVSYLWSELASA